MTDAKIEAIARRDKARLELAEAVRRFNELFDLLRESARHHQRSRHICGPNDEQVRELERLAEIRDAKQHAFDEARAELDRHYAPQREAVVRKRQSQQSVDMMQRIDATR